ncbi:CPBP family glutamic-type intramembrane protease [Halothermothrix orenii]|uniref:CPBP family glutamic-type intramembrane protease n=1 Tax=Halothermothrix orenii TaxID=31909 RepID=UPI00118027EC
MVGFVWAAWHIPLWFIKGTNQADMNFLHFAIFVMSLSFLLSIVYLARRSIFLCIILHAFANSFLMVFVPINKILPSVIILIFSILVYILFQTIEKIKTNSDYPVKN